MKSGQLIQVNNEDITIRPSSVDNFYQCAYQWAKVFLEGVSTIPGARASIGTSVHAAVETLWTDAIETGKKDPNLAKLTDAAMEAWKEDTHDGVQFDDGEDENTAAVEIVKGTEAFIDDIMPFTQIPVAVEKRFSVEIEHPLVERISGTVDYITPDTIADVKTSKRKPSTPNYTTQQSIYRYLAEANGVDVKHNLIQGVVFRKGKPADGMILDMPTNVPQAKSLVNNMLDVLEIANSGTVPLEMLFRGNPKYYLCNPKYCALYNDCPYVNGDS